MKVPTHSGGSMDARDLHRNNFPGTGKIEVIPKVPLTRETLPLAYTPGVAEVSREVGLGDVWVLAALPVMEGKALLFKAFGGLMLSRSFWPRRTLTSSSKSSRPSLPHSAE